MAACSSNIVIGDCQGGWPCTHKVTQYLPGGAKSMKMMTALEIYEIYKEDDHINQVHQHYTPPKEKKYIPPKVRLIKVDSMCRQASPCRRTARIYYVDGTVKRIGCLFCCRGYFLYLKDSPKAICEPEEYREHAEEMYHFHLERNDTRLFIT